MNKRMFDKTVAAVKAAAKGEPVDVAEGTAYMLQDAYLDGINDDWLWTASAVVIDKTETRVSVVGKITWDFTGWIEEKKEEYAEENDIDIDEVENQDVVPEDGADWPWDDMPTFGAYRADIWAEDNADLQAVIDGL